MATMQFQKATRKKSRLRCLVGGVSGSGKTTASLLIAQGLGGRTAVIDTERGSASLYSDLMEFDALELNPPYSPERYIEAINAAEGAGYEVLIIDSLTHVWDGSGGCVEINEQVAQAKYRGNTWSAWSDTTPRYRALLDTILQSPMHIICTSRMKSETVQGEDKKVRKIGMKTELRQGTEYEFTLVFEIEHEKHLAVVTKNRTNLFPQPFIVTRKTGEELRAWLESGAEIVREPPPDFVKRDEFVQRFKTALALDVEEGPKAEAVYTVSQDIKALGDEFQRAVWECLPSNERSAITKYMTAAKAQQTKILANGRAA
jgi:hypothetical protein